MTQDPEIKALNDVYDAIKDLDDAGKRWVIESISKKFFSKKPEQISSLDEVEPGFSEADKMGFSQFESVAEVISRSTCKKNKEKALMIASYLQEKEGLSVLTGRQINNQLKHLGYGVKNITVVINSLINEKPKLMIQIRKEGKSKQSKKKYRVTTEGLKKAKGMINY